MLERPRDEAGRARNPVLVIDSDVHYRTVVSEFPEFRTT